MPGHNISCNLHMEDLAKVATEGLEANKAEKAIIHIGKTIGILREAMEYFDEQHRIPTASERNLGKQMQRT